jgi:transposase
MAKPEKRAEARKLRLRGLSVKEISEQIGCAKSSVSVWVRDIALDSEQLERLVARSRNSSLYAQVTGAESNRLKALEQRQHYQQEGRLKAHERDWFHAAGCMLYWGEGSKDRNMCKLTNSDVGILQMFRKFLTRYFDLQPDAFVVQIQCYLEQGLTQTQIEEWWLNQLELPKASLRKTMINVRPSSSQQRGRKLLYGTCSLSVNSTHIVQHIFGAIQEYSGIDNLDWIV